MKIYNINREPDNGLAKYRQLLRADSWLFEIVENEFDKWLKDSNPASEYEEMYFGEDSIFEKKGAIRQAIEMIFDQMEEENKPFIYLKDVDLSCAFQY